MSCNSSQVIIAVHNCHTYNFCKVQDICTNTKQISTEKETLQLKEAAAGCLGSHDVLFAIYVPYKDEKRNNSHFSTLTLQS